MRHAAPTHRRPGPRPRPILSLWGLDRVGTLSFVVIAVVLGCIALAPFLTGYPEQGLGTPGPDRLVAPSSEHIMGTDRLGRDLWARILYGGRLSVLLAVLVVSLAVIIGTPLGIIAGYFGGWVDEVIMRVVDVFLAFPPLLLAIFLSALLGPGLLNLVLAIGLGWWPWYTRIARAQVLSYRQRPFVEAAEFMGVHPVTIMRRHLLPFVGTPVMIQSTLDLGSAILTVAALSFLGLGLPPPTPDWGQIISEGRVYFPDRWWYVTFPGLAIFTVALAFNLLGDSIRHSRESEHSRATNHDPS